MDLFQCLDCQTNIQRLKTEFSVVLAVRMWTLIPKHTGKPQSNIDHPSSWLINWGQKKQRNPNSLDNPNRSCQFQFVLAGISRTLCSRKETGADHPYITSQLQFQFVTVGTGKTDLFWQEEAGYILARTVFFCTSNPLGVLKIHIYI